MSDNTIAIERLIEASNKLWDAMYESGEVPTYAERAHYYLALKDAMAENAKLRELLRELYEDQCDSGDQWRYLDRMRELGVEVDE